MTDRTISAPSDEGSQVIHAPPKLRRSAVIARTVAFVGGASLLVGGMLGYALGFLEGREGKEDDHEV